MAVMVQGNKVPTELVAKALDYNAIKLTWTEPAGAFDWYEIWVMGSGGWMRRMPVKRGNSEAFMAGFDASTTYTFRMRTVRPLGPDKGWWNYGDWSHTTSIATNAARSADHTVTSQADWDNLTGVNYGDIIEITNSVTLTNETLPTIGGVADKFLTIRSATPTPSKGMNQRITLSEGQSLATFQITTTARGALTIRDDEDLINLENLRFKDGTAASARVNYLLLIGDDMSGGNNHFSHTRSLAARPQWIEVHRCLFEGQPPDAGGEVDQGVTLGSVVHCTVKDSYFHEITGNQSEPHGIWAVGSEQYIVDNCNIQAGIGFFSGGTGLGGSLNPEMIDYLPGLGYFTRNYFFWPLAWNQFEPGTHDGKTRINKNHWEIKYGIDFYVGGNVFENHWQGSGNQPKVIVLKVTNDFSNWVTSRSVLIENNIIDKVTDVFQMTASLPNDDTLKEGSRPLHKVKISNNLIKNNRHWRDNTAGPGGPLLDDGILFEIKGYNVPNLTPADYEVSHNTVIESNAALRIGLLVGGTQNIQSFTGKLWIRDNIVDFGDGNPASVFMDGGSWGQTAFDQFMSVSAFSSDGDFQKNLMYNDNTAAHNNATDHPNQLHEPVGINNVGFVDLAGGNYRLQNTSKGFQAATDGTDVGADIDTVDTETANSISGDWT